MGVSPLPRSRRELLRIWLPAVCLLTVVIGGMGVVLADTQQQARTDLVERNALRSTLASSFVSSYVSDIHAREAAHAALFLSAPVVSAAGFALASSAFGFDAAVLLDSRGRALRALPAKSALIGTRLDVKYAHLRAAVEGRTAVSNVVPSAVRSLPIVAFAVPFDTLYGRRVFSGGALLDRGPLAAFLADALPLEGARSYVIDLNGLVIVSGGSPRAALARPPETHGALGAVAIDGIDYRFTVAAIGGTPWSLLTLAPTGQLFAPLSGWQHWVPWAVLAAFGIAAAAALWLLSRLLRERATLAHLAMRDPLTGALNRRTLERVYHRLSAVALRSGASVGVLVLDLDRFKSVNDQHGHAAGDEVLCRVAEQLRLAVRPSDVVARIGGDEFVVLLSDVSEKQAHEVAARVHRTLDEAHFSIDAGLEIGLHCSVGMALADQDDVLDSVIARADGAMYRAKVVGAAC
jgi:diguanylate cyclase (GGDEF)-like protein